MLPKVAVVVVISRQNSNPKWVEKAIRSIKDQYYNFVQIILIDNNDKSLSIGAAWNTAINQCEKDVKWILFVGDDDYLSPDYLFSLIMHAEHSIAKEKRTVNISTYLTMFKEKQIDDKPHIYLEQRELIVTGLWNLEYLKANPVNEELENKVDTEMFDRMKDLGWKQEVLYWHYGYFYRVHEEQVSGYKKLAGKAHIKLKRGK